MCIAQHPLPFFPQLRAPPQLRRRAGRSACRGAVDAQARKSGDLSSLSHCDLQVMALTWQLHCEATGTQLSDLPTAEVSIAALRCIRGCPASGSCG
eukprot:COSAG01_NODE_477_length_16509_cov_38.684217_6_plen_96_part_00